MGAPDLRQDDQRKDRASKDSVAFEETPRKIGIHIAYFKTIMPNENGEGEIDLNLTMSPWSDNCGISLCRFEEIEKPTYVTLPFL